MSKPGSSPEFEIIQRYFATPALSFAREGIELGIGDDAALLDVPSDKQLAMSMDVLIADVHFPADADPTLIANRALAVNLSDLAAMGAQPFCFTLGLVLPHSDEAWLEKFSAGLASLAQKYDCPLVGGDTSSGPLSISIQVHGLVDRGRAALRSGGRIGDKIYVSGTLGDAAIALLTLGIDSHLGRDFKLSVDEPSESCREFFMDAYFSPQPQIELAARAGRLFTSCIDISDGLQGDLQHILDRSELAATINLDAIPYSDSALTCVTFENRLRAALFGGDDYELCFTVADDDSAELQRLAKELGLRISCIGELVAGSGIRYCDGDGLETEIPAQAFEHFKFNRAN